MDPQVAASSEPIGIEDRYAELFEAAVRAASEAGWGTPRTHEDVVAALQNMAIPASS